jgi:hypothetical protein
MNKDRIVLMGIFVGTGIPVVLMILLANGIFQNPFR